MYRAPPESAPGRWREGTLHKNQTDKSHTAMAGAHGHEWALREGKASGKRQHPSGIFREKALAKQSDKGRESALMTTTVTAKSTEYLFHVRYPLLVLTH